MAPPYPSPTKSWHTAPYAALDPARVNLSMGGKNVVITGGGGVIGSSIAQAFAEAGAAHIVLIGRTETTLAKARSAMDLKSSKVSFEVSDITDEAHFTSTIARIHAQNPVDIFVNNAGYLPFPRTINSVDMEEWWRSFEVNTKGSMNAIHTVLSQGIQTGTFINISAGLAHVPSIPGFSSYSISKLATAKLFEYLLAENPNFRVVNVHPGIVEGEMTSKAGLPPMDEARLSGNFVVWACSPEADFLNGKYVWANWDIEELKSKQKEIRERSIFTTTLEGWPFM